MGTRGVFGFQVGNQLKVTYNHFSSDPGGLGEEVLSFCKHHDLDTMKKMASAIELVDSDVAPTHEQIVRCREAGTIDLGVSEQSETDWYCLLRDAQGDLNKVTEVGIMIDSQSFLSDSLFCEWAYIINLDNSTLEVYSGFNEKPAVGRFEKSPPNDGGYYPVTLIATLDLTKEVMGGTLHQALDILGVLEKEEEEEEE